MARRARYSMNDWIFKREPGEYLIGHLVAEVCIFLEGRLSIAPVSREQLQAVQAQRAAQAPQPSGPGGCSLRYRERTLTPAMAATLSLSLPCSRISCSR